MENSTDIQCFQRTQRDLQELTNYCKKIRDGMVKSYEHREERAIWELVQNACDVCKDGEKVKITISLKKNRVLEFSHDGQCFDYVSLRALVQQNSAKDEKENGLIAGRYGTGFMTTHVFSKKVLIDGVYEVKTQKGSEGYVQLNSFTLDRTHWDNIEDAVREMGKELNEVENLYMNERISYPLSFKTTFTYQLDDIDIYQLSDKLENAFRLLPIVLLLNPKIDSVEIQNEISGIHEIHALQNTLEEFNINEKWHKYVSYITTSKGDTIKLHSLQSTAGDIVIIPPYPVTLGTIDDVPSLFMWFPLLGTEHFSVNFIFHSRRFYPVEQRNNIQLPSDKMKDASARSDVNVSIIKEMLDALFLYYDDNLRTQTLPIDCCKVAFNPIDNNDEAECRFCEKMQSLWCEHIRSWHIIPTAHGYSAMSSPNVKVLDCSLYAKLDKDKYQEYEPIISKYAANVEGIILPTNNLIILWSEIVHNWGITNTSEFDFVTPAQICQFVNSVPSDLFLFSFLSYLKESKNDTCFQDYALIPNRDGELCRKGALAFGKFIDENLYKRVAPLMGNDRKKMIDPSYQELCEVVDYTPDDLKRALLSQVEQLRRKSIGNYSQASLSQEEIFALINYCNAFSSRAIQNRRRRLMPLIASLFDYPGSEEYQGKWLDDEDDMYDSPFRFLAEYSLLVLSKKEQDWLNDITHRTLLINIVKEYCPPTTGSFNQDSFEKIKKYPIALNQCYQLCSIENLTKNGGICEDLRNLYLHVKDYDLRQRWVVSELEYLFTTNVDTPEAVAKEIEQQLEEEWKNENREKKYNVALLDLIPKLEDKEWARWFSHINEKKETFVFSLKSGKEQRDLFEIMKQDETTLSELALLSGKPNFISVLHRAQQLLEQDQRDQTDFEYKQALGKYVENELRKKLNDSLIECNIDDIQGGQDIVISKNGQSIYFIEVKSRWSTDQSVRMSTTQHLKSVDNKNNYALCAIDMTDFPREQVICREEMTPEQLEEFTRRIKCILNIGELNEEILPAVKESTENVHIASGYDVLVPQNLVKKGLKIADLIEHISNIANT